MSDRYDDMGNRNMKPDTIDLIADAFGRILQTPEEYSVVRSDRRELDLRTLMLLSALESWSFANNHRLPDHTLDELNDVCEALKQEVLK